MFLRQSFHYLFLVYRLVRRTQAPFRGSLLRRIASEDRNRKSSKKSTRRGIREIYEREGIRVKGKPRDATKLVIVAPVTRTERGWAAVFTLRGLNKVVRTLQVLE